MTYADFKNQQEESDARFARDAKVFYNASIIALFLVVSLRMLELFK